MNFVDKTFQQNPAVIESPDIVRHIISETNKIRRKRIKTLIENRNPMVYLDLLPNGISRLDLELCGYLCGSRIDSCATLSLDNFECLKFICKSQNPKEKSEFLHILADEKVVIICKMKK